MPTAPYLFILVGVVSVCEFVMVSGVCILLCPRKKRCTLLLEGTDVHIQRHNYQKDLNLFRSLFYHAKVIVELAKNTNKKFNCVYRAYDLTKQDFEISICFLFQLMSLSNLFPNAGNFLVLYLGCGCIDFNFTTQMTLRHLLPMPINKNWVKIPPNIF